MYFSYAFIASGVFLLLMVPFLISSLHRDPLSVLRPQWREAEATGLARVLGLSIIIVAFCGGIWAIYQGVKLLP